MSKDILDIIRGKGPVKVVNGKPKDFDLYDMEADNLYDELFKLKVIIKAVDELIEEKTGKSKDEINEEILNNFAGGFLSE
jgi:hypothetical protein